MKNIYFILRLAVIIFCFYFQPTVKAIEPEECIKPNAPLIGTTTQPTCSEATGSVTLTGLPASEDWTINPGSISNTGTEYTISGLTPGTYSWTVTTTLDCTSDLSENVIINVQPQPPAQPETITGDATVCPGTAQTYSVAPVTGATSYGWALPEGWQGSSLTNTMVTSAVGSGTISVAAINECGAGTARILEITVLAIPTQPGTITGDTAVCLGATETYSVAAVTGATSYTWTLPAQWSGTSVTNSITATTGPSGELSVIATNECGSGEARVIHVNAYEIPAPPEIGEINHPSCGTPGKVMLTGLPFPNTWTLTRNPGGVVTTGQGEIIWVTGINTGTYSFKVANHAGCISEASSAFTMNPVPTTPSAPSLQSIGQPTCDVPAGSVSLSGMPSSGTWTVHTFPDDIKFNSTGTTCIVDGLAPGTYTFKVSVGGSCLSPASSSAGIQNVPNAPVAPSVGTITQPSCAAASGSVVLNNLPSSGSWTVNGIPGNISKTGTGTSTTVSGLAPGSYTFSVTNNSGCKSGNSSGIIINSIIEIPSVPVVENTIQPDCDNTTGSISLSSLPESGWTLTENNTSTVTEGTGSSCLIQSLDPGTYNYSVTNTSGCSSAATQSITINAVPLKAAAPVIESIAQPDCNLETGSIILTNLPASGNWELQIHPGSETLEGTNNATTTVTDLLPGTYRFSVIAENGCLSDESEEATVNIAPLIPAAAVVSQSGNSLHSSVATGNQWYDGNGLIVNANSQDYSPGENGSYYVIVTADGCSSPASNTINFILTGIQKSLLDQSLNLYPNPVRSELTVEMNNENEKILYEIVNSTGLTVLKGNLTNKTIDVSLLSSGIYFLKLDIGNISLFRKIIKL